MAMWCPKCGFEQADDRIECLKCGIVFKKYRPAKIGHAQNIPKREKKTVSLRSKARSPDGVFGAINETSMQWCAGQSWSARLPVLIYFTYLLVRLINDPGHVSLMWYINFMIHEAGHVFFRPLGQFMMLAGGSILQCLFPMIFMGAFLLKKDLFAVSFCTGWFSTNLFYVSWYMADARNSDGLAMNPFGNEGWHDWFHIFNQMGVLNTAAAIGEAVKFAAVAAMVLSIISGFWLLWLMFKTHGRQNE